jgi:hypothetical protein
MVLLVVCASGFASTITPDRGNLVLNGDARPAPVAAAIPRISPTESDSMSLLGLSLIGLAFLLGKRLNP